MVHRTFIIRLLPINGRIILIAIIFQLLVALFPTIDGSLQVQLNLNPFSKQNSLQCSVVVPLGTSLSHDCPSLDYWSFFVFSFIDRVFIFSPENSFRLQCFRIYNLPKSFLHLLMLRSFIYNYNGKDGDIMIEGIKLRFYLVLGYT